MTYPIVGEFEYVVGAQSLRARRLRGLGSCGV
jgi:hypothetical protein